MTSTFEHFNSIDAIKRLQSTFVLFVGLRTNARVVSLVTVEVEVHRLDPALVGLERLLLVLKLGDESLKTRAAPHRFTPTLLLIIYI